MIEYLDKYRNKESLTKIIGLNPENPAEIPKIPTFLRSICTITDPGEQEGRVSRGTGFLAFAPAVGGICFFSAGLCLKHVLTAKRENNLGELEKCIIAFLGKIAQFFRTNCLKM